jgi:hypothetical protein
MAKSQWIDRFLTTLGPRVPTMQVEEALEWAELTYAEAGDMDPFEAAEVFALELPPQDAGAP